jgi:hypothetical protein
MLQTRCRSWNVARSTRNLVLVEVQHLHTAAQKIGRFRCPACKPVEFGARNANIVRHAFKPLGAALGER